MSTKKKVIQIEREIKEKVLELDLRISELKSYKERLETELCFSHTKKKMKLTPSNLEKQQSKITIYLNKSTPNQASNSEENAFKIETDDQLKHFQFYGTLSKADPFPEGLEVKEEKTKAQLNHERESDNHPVLSQGKVIFSHIIITFLENIFEIAFEKDEIGQEKISAENNAKEEYSKVKVTKATKVKNIYSKAIKQEVESKLKERSIQEVFLLYNGDIPRTTLMDWKNKLKTHKIKGKQGRKTPFLLLEEELFDWFLILRARKISVTNTKLQKKALKIKKNILEDVEVNEEKKKVYAGFNAQMDGCKTLEKEKAWSEGL